MPEDFVYQGVNLPPNQPPRRKQVNKKPKEPRVKKQQISKFGIDIFTKIDDDFLSLDWNVL